MSCYCSNSFLTLLLLTGMSSAADTHSPGKEAIEAKLDQMDHDDDGNKQSIIRHTGQIDKIDKLVCQDRDRLAVAPSKS